MPELVTMRITLDPVLKEQLKVRAIERGMTHVELLPKLLAHGLRSEPDKADAAPIIARSRNGQVPEESAAKIKDTAPPGPSVQETVTRLLADHGARVTSAFVKIAAREERIWQLCNQQQGRFDQAFESIGKRPQQAVERSNAQWRGVMRSAMLQSSGASGQVNMHVPLAVSRGNTSSYRMILLLKT